MPMGIACFPYVLFCEGGDVELCRVSDLSFVPVARIPRLGTPKRLSVCEDDGMLFVVLFDNGQALTKDGEAFSLPSPVLWPLIPAFFVSPHSLFVLGSPLRVSSSSLNIVWVSPPENPPTRFLSRGTQSVRGMGIGNTYTINLYEARVNYQDVCAAFVLSGSPAMVVNKGTNFVLVMYDGEWREVSALPCPYVPFVRVVWTDGKDIVANMIGKMYYVSGRDGYVLAGRAVSAWGEKGWIYVTHALRDEVYLLAINRGNKRVFSLHANKETREYTEAMWESCRPVMD